MTKHVVIIGAGPGGLSAAACLGERDVAYTLVDRGGEVAAGLRKVDPAMSLFSPPSMSRLPGMQLDATGRYPKFGELVAAIDRYRVERAIGPVTRAHVTAIERTDGGFVVRGRGDAGDVALEGTHVISATGIIANPRLPEDFDSRATKLRWMHSLECRREHVEASRRLLVVGAGASAADVLANWLAVRKPDDHAWIAVRSQLRAMRSSFLGIDAHYIWWLPEHLPGRPFGPWLLKGNDAMWGTAVAKRIKRGEIEEVKLARYLETAVELADGRTLEPDLVVFATGFDTVTSHLGDLVERDAAGIPILKKCESRRTPGLYLLGCRYGRTLGSTFLRGIARDAAYVARKIAAS
jgi:putative flavoprotein involved in K+ transport